MDSKIKNEIKIYIYIWKEGIKKEKGDGDKGVFFNSIDNRTGASLIPRLRLTKGQKICWQITADVVL